MHTTRRNLFIGVALVMVIILGYFAWQERKGSEVPVSQPTSMQSTSSTPATISITVSSTTAATSTGGYTITPIPISSGSTAPNYKTPLSFPAGMSADIEASSQSAFATIQTTLASKPTDWASWVELGILHKQTGDYAGAAADWTYVTKLYPSNPTAFADLGDLYANYLHQPSQAIANYKKAITIDPKNEASFYQNLAQVYLNEGDTTDAKATLQQGIDVQVIGYQNLKAQLNSL